MQKLFLGSPNQTLELITTEIFGLDYFDENHGCNKITNNAQLRKASLALSERVFVRLLSRLQIQLLIEAGAFDGRHSAKFLQYFEGRILAFEPNIWCIRKMSDALVENERYTLVPAALSDISEVLNFYVPKDVAGRQLSNASGISSIYKNNASTKFTKVQCSAVSLNQFRSSELRDISRAALWLDVEGNAIKALKGSDSIFSNVQIACIEVETDNVIDSGANADEVIQFLRIFGHRIIYRDFFNKGQCNILSVSNEVYSDCFDFLMQTERESFGLLRSALSRPKG
jgi:FkbM family methyltransferase